MFGTLIRSEDVPAPDRFEYWRETVGRMRASEMASAHAADFRAELRLMELGPVTVWPMSSLPTRYMRSPRMVRQEDRELYHLTLLLDGGLALDHAGRNGVFKPHDLHMVDGSRPYDLRPYDARQPHSSGGGLVRGVGVDFSKALLPLPPDRVRKVLGCGLSGSAGTGGLLAQFLIGLGQQAETLQPSDAPRLGTAVLDLVAAWLAGVLEAEASLPPESRQQALAQRILAFIRHNLHDPELTPPRIAEAHHISLSYLHRIFEKQTRGDTVAAWIRLQRLEGVRRDLENRSLCTTPIYAIGARWGIPRASDLTRAFRALHGHSPSEHRRRALRGPN
ncbi:helix-turn-helix domain-containing protein [Streptomyces physcomitrii]|uniref:AraC-like ligand-binding domain-containing protein n=1 Tax=Streptomyces physcomitrii TaxID=2724184 RepID=UPI00343EEE81